jgi:hypothetical protein
MDQDLREELDRIQANMLKIQADVMALAEQVALSGDQDEARNKMDQFHSRARKHHATLLLALESINPALAARLDKRREHREE